MARIFLSSEGEYRHFSHRLVAAIEGRGFNVWNGFNNDIEGSESYWNRVDFQLANAETILGVISSLDDKHVISELERAPKYANILLALPSGISKATDTFLRSRGYALFALQDWTPDRNHIEFERLIQSIEAAESERAILNAITLRRLDTAAFLASARQMARQRHSELLSRKPNGEKELEAWRVDNDLALSIIRSLDAIAEAVPEGDKAATAKNIGIISKSLTELGRLLGEWYKNNSADVVDGVIRTSLVGLVAGVGLIFGHPVLGASIGVAMFGSDKLAKGLASAVQGRAKGSG